MSSPSIEFQKIWIDQCAATEAIPEHFGLENALDYLIGEKLFAFLMASERIRSSRPSCRRSSLKSGASLRLRRSVFISTIWNVQSSWLRPIRFRTSKILKTKSKTSHGLRTL
jgi:hypothetical protein